MRIKVLGKLWDLRFAKNMKERGECDSPKIPGKEIRVSTRLRGEEKLEVTIHELLHAANWHLDEEWIEAAGRDIARALWRLGYRGPDDPPADS